MTTQDIANDLVALCKQGKFSESGEKYWASDVLSVEAGAPGTSLVNVYGGVQWTSPRPADEYVRAAEPADRSVVVRRRDDGGGEVHNGHVDADRRPRHSRVPATDDSRLGDVFQPAEYERQRAR